MLDLRPVAAGVPASYAELLPFLLMPQLWERIGGSVRSLVGLLR